MTSTKKLSKSNTLLLKAQSLLLVTHWFKQYFRCERATFTKTQLIPSLSQPFNHYSHSPRYKINFENGLAALIQRALHSFSCLSVCPSVCLSVCLSFVCVFSLYAMCNEASGGNADESFCVAALLSQALYHPPPPQPLNTWEVKKAHNLSILDR